ncbi:MAG: hypothetical protein JW712_14255 [Dehalococcoidales bacterium]|nr:hypothetical protein [Dehalococcoidales bacterium]
MTEDFSEDLVKDYEYWAVYIHRNQGYLGRCVVWCKRKDALDLTDATPEEREELFVILLVLKEAINSVFHPDWFNYAFLGNGTRHFHCHLIPRYATRQVYMGTVFEDRLYGHNYKTDHTFHTPKEVLISIREELKKALK